MKRFGSFLGFCAIAISASAQSGGVSCPGAHCPVTFEGFDPALHLIICETYKETLNVNPPSGQVRMSQDILIDTTRVTNCADKPLTTEWGFKWTNKESISHSCTGSLTMSVGFKVGQKDAAEVQMSGATTMENGWQWTSDWSEEKSLKSTITVDPCKGYKIFLYGQKRIGDHKGDGKYDWTCEFVLLYFGFPGTERFTASGECWQTNSRAHGEKWWFNTRTQMINIDPGCDKNAPCMKNCKKITPKTE